MKKSIMVVTPYAVQSHIESFNRSEKCVKKKKNYLFLEREKQGGERKKKTCWKKKPTTSSASGFPFNMLILAGFSGSFSSSSSHVHEHATFEFTESDEGSFSFKVVPGDW